MNRPDPIREKEFGKFSRSKPILCVDFDGVIHSYTSGWKGARIIPDMPVRNAINWLMYCLLDFDVNIYSSRSRYFGGRRAIKKWLLKYGMDKELLKEIKFPTKKPPAFLQIDDRAICFRGEFPKIETMLAFKPWYVKE